MSGGCIVVVVMFAILLKTCGGAIQLHFFVTKRHRLVGVVAWYEILLHDILVLKCTFYLTHEIGRQLFCFLWDWVLLTLRRKFTRIVQPYLRESFYWYREKLIKRKNCLNDSAVTVRNLASAAWPVQLQNKTEHSRNSVYNFVIHYNTCHILIPAEINKKKELSQ